MYKIIAFSLDGEYITEGEFKTIESAWNRVNDWGSRWIFYPIPCIIKNKTIVSGCDNFEFLNRKRIKTAQAIIKQEDFSFLY